MECGLFLHCKGNGLAGPVPVVTIGEQRPLASLDPVDFKKAAADPALAIATCIVNRKRHLSLGKIDKIRLPNLVATR